MTPRLHSTLAAAATIVALAAAGAPAAAQPLWGALERGPHAVGFRQLLLRDPSRPAIGGADGELPAAGRGRPMQIALWYPARAAAPGRPGRSAPRMTWGAYVDLLAQELDFTPPDSARRQAARERVVAHAAELGGDAAALRAAMPRLAALPVAAVRGARPAAGRFPLVLYPAWRMPATNGVLAEYLASHGYVVASTTLKGTFDAGVEISARGLETLAADLRHVVAALDTVPNVDASRIAGVGVGIAASGVLAHQMRTPAVRAIVSLEGGITTASELALLAATPYHDVAAVRVPLLAVTAPHPSVDAARLDRFRHATRHLVHFPRMGEFWFLDFGMLEREAPGVIGPPPGDVRAGFEWGARWVRGFLDAYLRDDAAARAALLDGRVPGAPPAPAGLFTVARRDAVPAPPTVAELKRVVARDGAAGVAEIAARRAAVDSSAIPAEYLVALHQWLANTGRDPRGDERFALARLRVRLHPRSARARLTFGTSALQRGDSALARAQLDSALHVLGADDDPALDAAGVRARVEQQARAALDRLRR